MEHKKCPEESELFDLVLSECDDNIKNELKVHLTQCEKCESIFNKLQESHKNMNDLAVKNNEETTQYTTVNKEISHYEISTLIGEGGMGEVYKATDKNLQRTVAIKIIKKELKNDPEFQQRFLTEAQLIAKLNHPNIIQIYQSDTFDEQIYLVMEYIEGTQLNYYPFKESNSFEEQLQILLKVTRGLQCAHENKIIHRDIKSSNIMIGRNGDVKLLDFGIARSQINHKNLTNTNSVLGSVAYMAPEVAKGEPASVCSDIYSLGIVLFEMVTKKLPFISDTPLAVIEKVKTSEIPEPCSITQNINPELNKMILKMCHKNSKLRYQNCDEVIQAITDFLKNHTEVSEAQVNKVLSTTEVINEVGEEMNLSPEEVKNVLNRSKNDKGKISNFLNKKTFLVPIFILSIFAMILWLMQIFEVDSQKKINLLATFTLSGDEYQIQTLKNGKQAYWNRKSTWKNVPKKFTNWSYAQIKVIAKPKIKATILTEGELYLILSQKSKHKFFSENKGWEKVSVPFFQTNHLNIPKFIIVKKLVLPGEEFTIPTTNFFSSMFLFKLDMLKKR
jgi:serine/threonine protein kinase